MILKNKTQNWEREVLEFRFFLKKAKGFMFKTQIDKPAVFFLNRNKISIWNFLVFTPFEAIALNENKEVKEKIDFPSFPKLKIKRLENCSYLIEDTAKRSNEYEVGDEIEFLEKDL